MEKKSLLNSIVSTLHWRLSNNTRVAMHLERVAEVLLRPNKILMEYLQSFKNSEVQRHIQV